MQTITGAYIVTPGGTATSVVIDGNTYTGTAYSDIQTALKKGGNVAVQGFTYSGGSYLEVGSNTYLFADHVVFYA